ncbi:hypothetical protein SAY86_012292 [Trapa natans]|uniref:RING-type E3 ubiquitin transferase n=1 Tax=Trapa natans TaxID=22666 RepID=A0AAN7RCW9_TRANT|nr:hypothetical protein SAY86_012292 [Trapa natans]
MSRRVLCKYFAHGACLKGEYCEFSHDWGAPSNNICTFYQKGICSFGSRCRYEHVKLSNPGDAISLSSSSSSSIALDGAFSVRSQEELAALHRPLGPLTAPAPNLDDQRQDHSEDGNVLESRNVVPADRPLCSVAAVGNCPRGETCPHIHGDLCPTCGKNCLHPFRPQVSDEHMAICQKKKRQLEALKLSQEIECSVCLEPVLSKTTAAERKFGILSECNHPFCITCIRNWRSSSPTPGMDVNSALRACPICRKLSYFIIPSVIWYTTKEEKEEIVDSYKAKLKSIDCKHFDFGNGSCPFGTSCFYKLMLCTILLDKCFLLIPFISYSHMKHAYRDGRLEEVMLCHLSAADGQTVIAKHIRSCSEPPLD